MGLFGFGKKEGGLMDVIRCDEQEYLVWKWRPAGADRPAVCRAPPRRGGAAPGAPPARRDG